MHIKDSINAPRGILEQSCEWDYELPMVNIQEQPVDMETADDYFTARLRDDQKSPH